jgi:hypothetical protein
MRQGHHPWLQHSNQSVQSGLGTPFPITARARFEVRTHPIWSRVIVTVKNWTNPNISTYQAAIASRFGLQRWRRYHWLILTGYKFCQRTDNGCSRSIQRIMETPSPPFNWCLPRYAICCCKRVFDPTQHPSQPFTLKSSLRHCHYLETFVVVLKLLNGPDFVQ